MEVVDRMTGFYYIQYPVRKILVYEVYDLVSEWINGLVTVFQMSADNSEVANELIKTMVQSQSR